MKLALRAALRGLSGLLLLGLLLFLPAGTLAFPNAWLLIGLLFVPMALVCVILLRKDRTLLEKRLRTKEQEMDQKVVLVLSAVQFFACFVLAGLDFRLGWSHFPGWLTILSAVLFLAGYALYAEVLRENSYLSRTVEIQESQKVIDTGLYGVVRHPMYAATVLLFWAMPLVLGSWIALIVMLPYPLILVKRIQNEEAVLSAGLPGYKDYLKKVRFRLLPFLW